MKRKMKSWRFLAPFPLVALAVSSGAVHAALIVTPTVTPAGGVFQYDYTIENGALDDDVVLVDIQVEPMDPSLTGLFAPAGFQAIYDFGLGIVSFLPELGSFELFAAGTSLSGFGFESAFSPQPGTFSALTIFGDLVEGETIAPLAPAPVPEPVAAILLITGLSGLAAFRGLHPSRRCRRNLSEGDPS